MFTTSTTVVEMLTQITRAATTWHFAVFAYCFMPDHLHLLVEGRFDESDLRGFAHAVKQRTSYSYSRLQGEPLWQTGYYEHLVRNDIATGDAARYILANPVRARLAEEPSAYPFSGSLVYDSRQLLDLWQPGTP
jgi:putative transposase